MNKTFLIIACFGSAVLFVRCSGSAGQDNGDEASTGASLADRSTPVQVSQATKGLFHYRIASNGDIRAAASYQVQAQTSGIIRMSKARDGAFFKKGDVILELETTPLQLQLEKAQSVLLNTQGEYQSRLLGYESLLKGKSQEQIKAIKQKLQAETGLSQAELEVRNAQWQLRQAVIHAPETGITANVKVSTGMQVNSGTPLFTLFTAHALLADVLVLEGDAGQVKTGQSARVTPVGKDAKTYAAVVSGINPIVDGNGMVTVHLKLKETKGLFPGMHVSSVIEVPRHQALIVPKSAVVLRSGDRPVVFTVQDSVAKWHYVKTGLDNGQQIEILDGISPGDTVITSNNIQLAHDAPVSIETTNQEGF